MIANTTAAPAQPPTPSSDFRAKECAPTEQEIREACLRIQSTWTERVRGMRRLRAQMAILFGVCRNL